MAGEVIALFGPTGVGKTAVALALAARIRAAGHEPVLISADALQLYRGLELLTGAADAPGAMRLVSVLGLDERCSAGRFARMAHAEIDAALGRGARPVVVGGTGLYLRAALADLDLRPPVAPAIRERWRRELAARGAPALHAELALRDPEAAARVAPGDAQRVVRALELLCAGERTPGRGGLWTAATRRPTVLVGLTMERAELARRIDARVDAMVAAGAAAEVRRADAAGAGAGARQALGFAELLRGDVDAMKARTRRYAKRQLTWLRKLPGVHLIDVTGRRPEDVARSVPLGG